MAEYIDRDIAIAKITDMFAKCPDADLYLAGRCIGVLANTPAADVDEVVRCQNCIHSVPLDRNSELNSCFYMHCTIERGEEVRNVWHKYKKYYKDYSVVDRNGFCDSGERKTDETDT